MPSQQSTRPRARKAAAAEPRRRRSAEDAKRAILDAAEARFAQRGPAGIRLQEIAADVGVSHPAILHHFGSREDLMRAVIERALGALREEVLATLATPDPSEIDVAALIERVFETLGGHGQARLMAWLALAGEERRGGRRPAAAPFVRQIAETVHAQRVASRGAADHRAPPFEDSLFAILLVSFALIGDALLGETTRASSGLDPASGRRFRNWFSELLVAHLAGDGAQAAPAKPAARRKARGRARDRD